ncbi:PREDICTED: probable polygalacturonase At3g15720-like [Fragaria vesca subsp. vesca]
MVPCRISIGSLGEDGSYSTMEDVQVRNCTFKGTQNGARIKTWQG